MDSSSGSYLHLHMLTYNVAGNELSTQDVETLFEAQESPGLINFLEDTDILVVGLQEAYQGAVASAIPVIGKDNLVETFSSYLCTKGFARLQHCRLLGILTIVFLKRPLLCYTSRLQTSSIRTGFGGLWGNKGSASIRFRLGNVTMAFSNCHLVPHEENNDRRATELNDILTSQTFYIEGYGLMRLLDHDLTILFGDLNYRLEGHGYQDIVSSLADNDKSLLFKMDQLRLEQVKGDKSPSFLHRFMEMEIDFEPSYKYEPGSDRFDISKGRPPAWCDRVLWTIHRRKYPKVTDAEPISLIKPVLYDLHTLPKLSDHRAVSSRLQVMAHINSDPKVVFRMAEWVCGKGGIIEFDVMVGTDISLWDWVGLYSSDFISVESDYLYWIYTPAIRGVVDTIQYYKRGLGPDKVLFPPGMYVLVYFSSFYKCVTGMSPVFRILSK